MLLYKDEYQCWLENAVEDDLHSLLRKMSQEEIEDAFIKIWHLEPEDFWGDDRCRDKPDECLHSCKKHPRDWQIIW